MGKFHARRAQSGHGWRNGVKEAGKFRQSVSSEVGTSPVLIQSKTSLHGGGRLSPTDAGKKKTASHNNDKAGQDKVARTSSAIQRQSFVTER
jgi:hypothetical protein